MGYLSGRVPTGLYPRSIWVVALLELEWEREIYIEREEGMEESD